MKRYDNDIMELCLKRGVRLARYKKTPREGMSVPLYIMKLRNNYYYQVDYIKDSRICKGPFVLAMKRRDR